MGRGYLEFEDIANLTVLKEFYKLFFELTGLVVDYNSVDGESQMAYSTPDDLNPFCRLIRSTPGGLRCCIESSCKGGQIAFAQKSAHVYICHAGLVDIAVPVIIRKRHIATIAVGQILLERPTTEGFRKIKAKLEKVGRWNWQALENCYFATMVISDERLESIIKLLELVAGYVFAQEDKLLLLQQENEQQAIRSAKNYIAAHYGEKLRLEDVAAKVHLSPCYLSKLFKQETEETIGEYITRVRIAKAKELLLEGDQKLIEIAGDIGYDSPSHFSRTFKRYEGVSPSEYRNQNR
jgi:AraC-like DNA-binding protein